MNKCYLLDANAFIEAKNRYYGFDLCPGFWSALVAQHAAERIFSIDRIADELKTKDDALKDWVEKQAPETFFKQTEEPAVIDKFQEMMKWVYEQAQFNDAAKAEFASVADGWLVAYAAANGPTVVTHETYAPNVKRKVPIPNVCLAFSVEYVNTFDMLKRLREQFIRRG